MDTYVKHIRLSTYLLVGLIAILLKLRGDLTAMDTQGEQLTRRINCADFFSTHPPRWHLVIGDVTKPDHDSSQGSILTNVIKSYRESRWEDATVEYGNGLSVKVSLLDLIKERNHVTTRMILRGTEATGISEDVDVINWDGKIVPEFDSASKSEALISEARNLGRDLGIPSSDVHALPQLLIDKYKASGLKLPFVDITVNVDYGWLLIGLLLVSEVFVLYSCLVRLLYIQDSGRQEIFPILDTDIDIFKPIDRLCMFAGKILHGLFLVLALAIPLVLLVSAPFVDVHKHFLSGQQDYHLFYYPLLAIFAAVPAVRGATLVYLLYNRPQIGKAADSNLMP